jgi:tyrosyl-tRNA synthetase
VPRRGSGRFSGVSAIPHSMPGNECMTNTYDVLRDRGFVEQCTDEEGLRKALEGRVLCYAGFDPTAPSLHVGHLLPVMALAHMQRQGHCPIIVLGGGTAMIGDPSGKNEMRRILSREEIDDNASQIKKQFARYMDLEADRALICNNADWLVPLHYIDFLRDIGRHFSVNRMLAAESYKMRLETGLNFIEFNYMLLQAYDFLYLYRQHGCLVQLGGNDQWGNIVAGIDLIRKAESASAYGLTFPLITTASGAKMGKTEQGAVWLDPGRTSPYHYYQYWINADDRDIERFLNYFTFLAAEEIAAVMQAPILVAKERLAFEVTSVSHGREAAEQARRASRSVFYGEGAGMESLPETVISRERLSEGIPVFVLFAETGLCATRSDARRLIAEGGGYINSARAGAFDELVDMSRLQDGCILLRAGKKRYHRIIAGE